MGNKFVFHLVFNRLLSAFTRVKCSLCSGHRVPSHEIVTKLNFKRKFLSVCSRVKSRAVYRCMLQRQTVKPYVTRLEVVFQMSCFKHLPYML